MGFEELVDTKTVGEIIGLYPIAHDFFVNYNLNDLPLDRTFSAAVTTMPGESLEEFGLTPSGMREQLLTFLETMMGAETSFGEVRALTIRGGKNKAGVSEEVELTIRAGQTVSIVGPTGSGKSRLLGDIECIAQGDTPTGRQILINGQALDDEARFEMDGVLVAQLSQNMNFVMDLTVAEFLELHAKSRFCAKPDEVCAQCFTTANELAGETFLEQTKVTQLSGGQSRALMIADTAYMSASPIVLIDEIENAGVDRKRAIRLLARREKIVLISTHDPILALNADMRIVIKNGGIHKIIETSPEEKESLASIEVMDNTLQAVRNRLRMGERIVSCDMETLK
ncbi:MAG: ATP-binding cassette domain-containing protein [Ethanoligenens sp.]|uniref:ATP-binding cassette domain-containing protein n=1 Tax=Ethanoligenens sp. TaxID=2099655 RepID=UPI0039ECB5EA